MEHSLFSGHGELLLIYVALVLVTKSMATASTNGGGGCGGTFAPSLFVGAFAGFLFARTWNTYNFSIYIPENNFALLGMAGVMSGVMHAPLTGVFLIAELTGGYNLFIPLLIVSTVSYLTIYIFEVFAVYFALKYLIVDLAFDFRRTVKPFHFVKALESHAIVVASHVDLVYCNIH